MNGNDCRRHDQSHLPRVGLEDIPEEESSPVYNLFGETPARAVSVCDISMRNEEVMQHGTHEDRADRNISDITRHSNRQLTIWQTCAASESSPHDSSIEILSDLESSSVIALYILNRCST